MQVPLIFGSVRRVVQCSLLAPLAFAMCETLHVQNILANRFSYLLNGAVQRGSYSADSIHAGEAFAKVYYRSQQLRLSPRFGAEYDYASGEEHVLLEGSAPTISSSPPTTTHSGWSICSASRTFAKPV